MEGVQKILLNHKTRIEDDMKKTKTLLDNDKFKASKPDEWQLKRDTYEKLDADLKTIQVMLG